LIAKKIGVSFQLLEDLLITGDTIIFPYQITFISHDAFVISNSIIHVTVTLHYITSVNEQTRAEESNYNHVFNLDYDLKSDFIFERNNSLLHDTKVIPHLAKFSTTFVCMSSVMVKTA
jgi:hypothetical protein